MAKKEKKTPEKSKPEPKKQKYLCITCEKEFSSTETECPSCGRVSPLADDMVVETVPVTINYKLIYPKGSRKKILEKVKCNYMSFGMDVNLGGDFRVEAMDVIKVK